MKPEPKLGNKTRKKLFRESKILHKSNPKMINYTTSYTQTTTMSKQKYGMIISVLKDLIPKKFFFFYYICYLRIELQLKTLTDFDVISRDFIIFLKFKTSKRVPLKKIRNFNFLNISSRYCCKMLQHPRNQSKRIGPHFSQIFRFEDHYIILVCHKF